MLEYVMDYDMRLSEWKMFLLNEKIEVEKSG